MPAGHADTGVSLTDKHRGRYPIFGSSTPLIDLHTHILPDVDDGARNETQALEMLRIAMADGIQTIVATPHSHHVPGEYTRHAVDALRQLANKHDLGIEILAGHEARIAPDLAERYQRGDLLTINGSRYQLTELHFQDWPQPLAEQSIGRIQAAGLVPLLAHPERFLSVQEDPDWIGRLIERGMFIQINAHSLTGYHGEHALECAELLIRRRQVHVIASDAHNPGRRPPAIREALERAASLAGADYARWLIENAHAIIENREIDPMPPAAGTARTT